MIEVPNNQLASVLAFVRQKDNDALLCVMNLSDSDQARDVTLHGELRHGTYVDYFARTMVSFTPDSSLRLPAWGYRVFVRSGRLPG